MQRKKTGTKKIPCLNVNKCVTDLSFEILLPIKSFYAEIRNLRVFYQDSNRDQFVQNIISHTKHVPHEKDCLDLKQKIFLQIIFLIKYFQKSRRRVIEILLRHCGTIYFKHQKMFKQENTRDILELLHFLTEGKELGMRAQHYVILSANCFFM